MRFIAFKVKGAVSGYTGDMLPPVCLEAATYCTFNRAVVIPYLLPFK